MRTLLQSTIVILVVTSLTLSACKKGSSPGPSPQAPSSTPTASSTATDLRTSTPTQTTTRTLTPTLTLTYTHTLPPTNTRTPTPPHSYMSQWGSYGMVLGNLIDIWVDAAGNQYIAVTGNPNHIIKVGTSDTILGEWAPTGAGAGQVSNPGGIAVDASGYIYISDISYDRVTKFNASGVYQTHWGGAGSTDGLFSSPKGIAFDTTGNVYVVDSGNNRIQKFSNTGGFLGKWGSNGVNNGQFNNPSDIAIDPSNNVYVMDTGNDRVQKFTTIGGYVGQWGSSTDLPGCPHIAVDPSGNVYTGDTSLDRIQKFDGAGNSLTYWSSGNIMSVAVGGPSTYVYAAFSSGVTRYTNSGGTVNQVILNALQGRFNAPALAAFNNAGELVVADRGNRRVQSFYSGGGNLDWATTGDCVGVAARPVASGYIYVSSWAGTVNRYDSTLLNPVGFSGATIANATGMAVDPTTNDVYVADYTNDRILRYNALGTYQSQWGATGNGNSQFNGPYGIATDASGNVYVADSGNNRVQKFNNTATYLTQWGTSGAGNGQFNQPLGVAVSPTSGTVLVTDYANDRVQEFTSGGVYVFKWGTTGASNGQFDGPIGIAVNSTGNVYVVDSGNNRIQQFRP